MGEKAEHKKVWCRKLCESVTRFLDPADVRLPNAISASHGRCRSSWRCQCTSRAEARPAGGESPASEHAPPGDACAFQEAVKGQPALSTGQPFVAEGPPEGGLLKCSTVTLLNLLRRSEADLCQSLLRIQSTNKCLFLVLAFPHEHQLV